VLATRGKAEFFGGVGSEFQDPVREPFGVKEFARTWFSIDQLDIRVGCIMLVKEIQRSLEAGGISSMDRLRHGCSIAFQ
jgi:hypothetical protein